ncbi:MAG: putative manganese-dependent inorganic diphosphatase, partial [Planctomycetota bacterium]
MTVHVFGHRNPDTDAICSALAYADYLQKTTHPDAVAACCGPPNARTEFALRKSGLSLPRIIMDVRPEVDEVCNRSVVCANESDVFYEVYERLIERGIRSIPVANDDGELVGVMTLLHLLELVFAGGVDPIESRKVSTSLAKICKVVDGTFQNEVDPHRADNLLVTVGAMSAGGFKERMKPFPSENLLVISGDRPTIQLPALELGVRCLVVTGGFELTEGLLELASARKVAVILSPYDTATTTMRIKAARRIRDVVQRDFVSFPHTMSFADAKEKIVKSSQTIFPVVDNDKHCIGVISKSDLANVPKPKIVLVDHNELSQAVHGADEAEILQVLDHHRLGGGLKSSTPIRFINEPVGSTCTLVARMYRASGMDPTPSMALCMASGMISDTLNLRSPTTTDVDRDTLKWLQGFIEQDLNAYADEFFQVGSALRSCTADQVVREDCKEFSEDGRRFSISQIEEIGFDRFWNRKQELRSALEQMAGEKQYEFSALLITDIASNGSLLLM